MNQHEDLSRQEHVEGSSDRSFGFVFAVVFGLVGLWPLVSGQAPRAWAWAIAAVFAALALFRPAVLAPLNRLWLKFGLLLGRVVSPIALGVLFFGAFAGTGVLMRMLGKDPLRLKLDPDAASYWIARDPPGPAPDSMKNQF